MRLFGAKNADKKAETKKSSSTSSVENIDRASAPGPSSKPDEIPIVVDPKDIPGPSGLSDLPTPDMTFSGDKIAPEVEFKIPSPMSFDSDDDHPDSEITRVHDHFYMYIFLKCVKIKPG